MARRPVPTEVAAVSTRRTLFLSASVLLAAAAPSPAVACAVCFGGQESQWTSAFLAGTMVMLVLPPAILLGGGITIYRAIKRQEARVAERDALASATGRPASPAPVHPRHLRSV